MASPVVGIVTGANKGIGYAIVRKLALQWPSSHLGKLTTPAPLLIYLTARDQSRGEAALSSIRADEEIAKAGVLDRGAVDLRFHQLDVASPDSIEDFARHVGSEHPDGVDFLVNNAGTAMDGFDLNIINTTLDCNFYGLIRTTRALLPHLKPAARIVNMASLTGMLSRYSPEVAARFRAARTEAEATALMRGFADAATRGNDEIEKAGYPLNRSYGVSKAGVIAFTRALAEELAQEDDEVRRSVLVNCVCPGWVKTDMTKGKGTKTVEEGAETPVMLALEDLGGRSGGYWTNGKEEEW
jgi:carbonyl reductase 1